jgi:hypothetical protein
LTFFPFGAKYGPAFAAKGSKASAVMQNISSPISATTEECHVIFG